MRSQARHVLEIGWKQCATSPTRRSPVSSVHPRWFSDSSSSSSQPNPPTNYIDEWFSSIVKSEEFYEDHANDNPRRYFYNIDLQGRLFLEETLPKNIATSIKDARFLDFFHKRIRSLDDDGTQQRLVEKIHNVMETHGISKEEYPYVSPCGNELNFIRPAATPIVFHTLEKSQSSSSTTGLQLIFGGSLSQEFQPSDLALSQETGRLYHKCHHMQPKEEGTGKYINGHDIHQQDHGYALIRSAVVVSLSDQIGPMPDDGTTDADSQCSGLGFFDENHSHPQSIPWLPQSAEPGDWAMPFVEGAE